MATEREKLEQLAGIFQKSGKKVSLPDEPSATRSGISANISSRTAEEKTEERSKLESLAGIMQKNGYKVNLPAEKKQAVSTGYSKASSVLPQSTKRTEKNSPTTQAKPDAADNASDSKVSLSDWLSGASKTFTNAAFWSIPNTVNNVLELAFDWLQKEGGNISSALGVPEQKYQDAVQNIRELSIPEDDVLSNIYRQNQEFAQEVQDKSKSAKLVYPLVDTLGQIAQTSMTAGAGTAAGLTSDAVRGTMIASDLARNVGTGYTSRKDDGQRFEAAALGSILEAVPTTAIEFTGGNEDLIQGAMRGDFGTGWKDWLIQAAKSSASEAGEEILQDPLSGLADLITGQNPQILPTRFDAEEDSVFNLARMLQSAGYAAAGSFLSAGAGRALDQGASRVLDEADRVTIGSEIKRADGGDQLLKIAAASESQEVQAQRSEIMGKLRKGQNASAYSLGKLAESLSNDATINLVTATKRMHTADNTQRTQAMPIDNQSAEKVSAIDAEIRRYTTGAVQNANAMTAQQTDSEVIEEYASRLGENGQKAFRQVAGKTGSGSFQRVKNAFQAYYNYGNWGKKIEDVSSAFSDALTSDQAYQAFTAGQNDAAASLQAQTASAVKAQGKGRLLSSSAASMVDGDTRKYLDEIGRALGVQIEIEAGERDASGNLISNGRVEGGKIYLSAASQKPIASVLNHELTHVLQERSPEQYREYKNFVASYLDSQNSGWFESQVQRMIDGYDSIGESISREMAEDEVVSDAAERFLSDETAVKDLVKENRSVAQKVLDAIRDIIHRLASIVRGDNDAESTASRLLREQEDVFRQAEKMWAKALSESSPKTNQKKPAQNKKSSAGKAERVRYQLTEDNSSVDERFFKFINRVLNGELQGKNWPFTIGPVSSKTAEAIARVTGVDVSGFTHKISVDAVNHIIRRHGENGVADHSMANPADIAQIPYALENFESVELLIENGQPERSSKYKNADNTSAYMVKFDIPAGNNTMYVVEAVPDSKNKTLWVVTAYAGKTKEEGGQVPKWSNAPSRTTSETPLASYTRPSSNFSISETEGENNQQSAQTLNESPQSRRQLSEYVVGDDDEYEFSHAQPDENYQLEGRDDDPRTSRSREQDIEAIGLDTRWLDRHISGAISMDESGTLEDRIDTLKKESEVLKNVRLSDEQLEKIAGRVLKEYDSNLNEKEFTAAVKSAVEHIGRRGAKGYEQAFVSIYDEMVKALEQSESLDKSLWDAPDVKEIRKSIRETRLYLSDDQKRDFQNFPEYKRDHREFRLVNDPAALSVDRFYSELAENYPGYFDPDKVSARDMLDEISDWLEAVRPTVVNWYEGNIEQVAADAAADILHQVNQVKSRMPEGRLTKQMIAQQERFAERYRQLKEQYQKKLQKADDRLKLEKEKRVLDREKAAERIQQLKAHNREVKKRASDRRAIAQSRAKIERVVDRLSRKLLKPTDTQNVPVELRGAVSGFLQAIDFRSYKGGEVSDTHKTQRWQDLQNVLARISREEGADGFDGTYLTVDPDAERRIRELMQAGAPANLSELSREQMLELEKLVKAVDHMVRYAGKVRLEGQMQEATVTARQIIEENAGKGKEIRQTGKTAVKLKNFFVYDLLDPTRFSDMFGDGFYKIVHNLRMAENTKISYWKQATDAFDEMISGLGYSKKDVRKMGEDEQVVRIGAREVKMSTAQIMSLYLMNKREQGRSHLYGGGIKLPDSGGRRITQYAKSYRITEQEVDAIVSKLSDKQRQLADKMQAYLSGDVAEWGNRMSRYLYGYDKFTEKNYWPISSDPNYTRAEVSLSQGEMKNASIKNLGMTKTLVEKASNPVILDPAFQVFASHTTQMAAYGAYVGPLEDLNKVINWQTRHDGNWRSVREAISAAGGKGAINYLNKLIDDVNGQSRGESDPYSGLMGAAKAASIAGNLRVVVQQPTAYWRAMAVIPPQYLVKGMVGRKVNVDEMHTIAPISQWKEWGYFRDGVAGSNILELMQGKSGAREKLVDWSMSLAGKADDMTWRQIYRAVESWVAGTTGFERGSEAFRQEVGKRFTEVVDRTQVVDSVFQRTQAMRNTGFGWKLATAFMAEPLKSYNLLVGSARNFAGAPKDKKKDALGTMLMSALGFAVSSIVNAVMQSAWDIGRDKDPDEKIVEKFMQAMFGDTINDVKKEGGSWYDVAMAAVDGNLAGNFNPMSMIPVLNDIWSMLEGYDPEVMGLDTISDILSSGQTLYKSVSEGGGKYTAGYNAIQFIRKLSAATGLPVGNIYREVESLVNFSVTAAGDWLGMDTQRLRFEINKLYLNPDQNRNVYYQSILDARAAGDDGLAVEIANYLLSKGIKRSSIETGLSNLIVKDEANAGLISEYAQAYEKHDMQEMARLEEEGEKAGLSGLDLQDAAERYLKGLEPETEETEPEEEFSEQDFQAGAEYDTGYLMDALVNAIVGGDQNAGQDMKDRLKASGKTEEEIEKSVQSELKSRLAENAGFDSVSQMKEAGEEFDVNSREYQILHDRYGYTQYGYSDLYDALVSGRGYEAIYDDMLGQTSSGDSTYSADGIEKEMKSRLQEDFNTRYKGGTGSGWEFYMNKLKEYGKSWDDILTSWKRSKAGKEWNDSH